MSKVSVREKQEEIKKEIQALERDKALLYQTNNDKEEASYQAQEVVRMIRFKQLELDNLKKNGKNKTYALARIIVCHGKGEEREVDVVIKDYSIPESFSGDRYIVSYETEMAKAIFAVSDNKGVATYSRGEHSTSLRVLFFKQKEELPL